MTERRNSEMKYIKPEINLKLFELENIVTTSVLGDVENLLTGGSSGSNGLKLDGKNDISETSLFSFDWIL